MMLYRSLVVGLLGACLFLVARPRTRVVTHSVHARVQHLQPRRIAMRETRGLPTPPTLPTLIDVSSRMTLDAQLSQVRLQPGESITSFDHQTGYIDIGLRGPGGERRVLVLEH
jgi:hypothetical protein